MMHAAQTAYTAMMYAALSPLIQIRGAHELFNLDFYFKFSIFFSFRGLLSHQQGKHIKPAVSDLVY